MPLQSRRCYELNWKPLLSGASAWLMDPLVSLAICLVYFCLLVWQKAAPSVPKRLGLVFGAVALPFQGAWCFVSIPSWHAATASLTSPGGPLHAGGTGARSSAGDLEDRARDALPLGEKQSRASKPFLPSRPRGLPSTRVKAYSSAPWHVSKSLPLPLLGSLPAP